jgi:hypothetical protein
MTVISAGRSPRQQASSSYGSKVRYGQFRRIYGKQVLCDIFSSSVGNL